MKYFSLEELFVDRLAWLVLPGVPLVGVACAALAVSPGMRARPLPPWVFLLLFFLLFALAAAAAAVLRGRLRDLTAQKATILEQVRTVQDHNQNLHTQLEVLTAMREVSRVISDDVDFHRIIEKMFQILGRLLNPDEILVIVKDESSGTFVPRAMQHHGQITFSDLDPKEADDELVQKAIVQGEMQKRWHDGRATVVSPLVFDRELAGAIKFVMRVDCPFDEAQKRLAGTELVVSDIARHIALAIKMPSLHHRAIVDGLTGLYSRRHFENQLREHSNLARRYNKPLSLIMIDIDNFKLVNNRYGHPSGDAVLAEVATVLKANVRDCDSVFRYGGEEIAVILPETAVKHSRAIAERIRKTVNEKVFLAGRHSIRMTISLGIAELDHASKSYDDLVSRADQALYDAKARGRNCMSEWADGAPCAAGGAA